MAIEKTNEQRGPSLCPAFQPYFAHGIKTRVWEWDLILLFCWWVGSLWFLVLEVKEQDVYELEEGRWRSYNVKGELAVSFFHLGVLVWGLLQHRGRGIDLNPCWTCIRKVLWMLVGNVLNRYWEGTKAFGMVHDLLIGYDLLVLWVWTFLYNLFESILTSIFPPLWNSGFGWNWMVFIWKKKSWGIQKMEV